MRIVMTLKNIFKKEDAVETPPVKCKKCGMCAKTGCPAIYTGETVTIDAASCTGCSVCSQVCPFDAIKEV